MKSQTNSPAKDVAVSVRERVLVLWLALTFLLCVFVSFPNPLTARYATFRGYARSYLRTLGVDQYWTMFVGLGGEAPQLRIIATTDSGAEIDATQVFLHQGILYRHVLDDHVGIAHIVLARGDNPQLLASYAEALRSRLGPEIREIRFEQVFRVPRPRRGSREPTTTALLAVYRWD
jgi:hypothetical protein